MKPVTIDGITYLPRAQKQTPPPADVPPWVAELDEHERNGTGPFAPVDEAEPEEVATSEPPWVQWVLWAGVVFIVIGLMIVIGG